MIYFEFNFTISPLLPTREILIGELCELGFDSFVDTETGLLAYGVSSLKDSSFEELIAFNMEDVLIQYESKEIKDENWNAEWEKNFNPIEVEEKCYIRAPFHERKDGFEQEVIIQPQMSFGTGHHETTWLICRELFGVDLKGKSVLDMGCGTGVLAILAEKLGASSIKAIDIDEWSYSNTIENIALNNSKNIVVKHGDKSLLGNEKYDVVLANINRNILLNDMDSYADVLNPNAIVIFSGFYDVDADQIKSKASELNMSFVKMKTKNNWAMVKVQTNS